MDPAARALTRAWYNEYMRGDFERQQSEPKVIRDIDFRPRSDARAATNPSPKPVSRPGVKKKQSSALLIAIIGLAAAALGTYYWSGTPPQSSSPASAEPSSPSERLGDVSTNGTIFDTSDTLLVQVYESGADQATITSALETLKREKYQYQNLGASQFEYDKTYIWYTAGYAEEAQAIGRLLTGRSVSYKESQNSGVFDVLIYLGKQ